MDDLMYAMYERRQKCYKLFSEESKAVVAKVITDTQSDIFSIVYDKGDKGG